MKSKYCTPMFESELSLFEAETDTRQLGVGLPVTVTS